MSILWMLLACNPSEPEWTKVPDSAPLRRLSTLQYKNTMRELYDFTEEDEFLLDFPAVFSLDGFNNNAQMNTPHLALVESYQRASLSVTKFLLEEDFFDVCDEDEECIEEWLYEQIERLWRRPLVETEKQDFWNLYNSFLQEVEYEIALQLVFQYALQAPDFIYFVELGDASQKTEFGIPLTTWELATRMSYFLWNAPPDEELIEAAQNGSLNNEEEIIAQAWRMVEDPRARNSIEDFHSQWLELDKVGSTSLDFALYDIETFGYDHSDYLHQILQPDMQMETKVFIDDIIFHRSGLLSEIFLASTQYTTEPLSVLYGVEISDDANVREWENEFGEIRELYEVDLPSDERAGVLTHLGILNSHSTPKYPSPIKRGVFIKERILCQPIGSPPSDIPPLESSTVEPQTNRERYAIHSQSPVCSSCHKSIDGLGFPFEHYDAIGQYRTHDNEHLVNAQGEIFGTDVDGEVENAIELTQKFAQSRSVHDCYADQMFRYAFGRSSTNTDKPTLNNLKDHFWSTEGNIAELMVLLVSSHKFRHIEEK